MRKFSYKTPEPQEVIPQLSVEEEAIAIDEQNQAETEIEQTSNDIDQLGDIIVTMGDVQTVVSNTPEIKPIEQALISSVADAAVAGTDADPEELAGSMLPDAGVSTESFVQSVKDTLSKIWQTIKDAIIKMWDHIKAVFVRFQEFVTGTKRRVAKLEKLVATVGDMSSYKISANDSYRGPIDVLMVRDKPTVAIGKDFKEMQEWVATVVVKLAESGKNGIDGCAEVIEKFLHDPTGTNKNSSDAMKTMAQAMTSLSATVHNHGDGDSVLGGLEFHGILPRDRSFSLIANDDTLAGLREFEADLRLRATVSDNRYEKVKIPLTNKIDEIKTVLQCSQQYVKDIEAKSFIITKLSEHGKRVCLDIDTVVKKHNERIGVDQEAVRIMKMLFSINAKINSMIASNLNKVVSHTNRVTNGVLDYAIQSCELVAGKSPVKEAEKA